MTAPTTVIIGAGQAGSELAFSLRQQGYTGAIVLIGDEGLLPYRRPPLSKAYLLGDVTLDSLLLRAQTVYDKNQIDVRLGVGVEKIDRAAHSVQLDDGSTLSYDKLALATGARPRKLTLPGADKANVHYIRTVADIEKLQPQFQAGKRLVVIGGGYVGLEVAAVARKKQLQVTVLEAAPRVLARVTAPEISAFYERVHREHGVDLRTNTGVHAFEGDDLVSTVITADGARLPADLVVVGVGAIPNTELAAEAGLEVSNGIVVDRYAMTSDIDIVAAGDCTFHENVFLNRRLRLESVPNAMEQSRIAAASIVGNPRAYAAVPWFWSDQYDLKLQMVGLSEGYDQLIIRGKPDENHFCGFYLRDGVVISVDVVNQPQDFVIAKRLVSERIAVNPAQLSDDSVTLKTLLPTTS